MLIAIYAFPLRISDNTSFGRLKLLKTNGLVKFPFGSLKSITLAAAVCPGSAGLPIYKEVIFSSVMLLTVVEELAIPEVVVRLIVVDALPVLLLAGTTSFPVNCAWKVMDSGVQPVVSGMVGVGDRVSFIMMCAGVVPDKIFSAACSEDPAESACETLVNVIWVGVFPVAAIALKFSVPTVVFC